MRWYRAAVVLAHVCVSCSVMIAPVLQKAVFRLVKGGLLEHERWSFTLRKTAFYGMLVMVLISGRLLM